jgi:hypothetical protein
MSSNTILQPWHRYFSMIHFRVIMNKVGRMWQKSAVGYFRLFLRRCSKDWTAPQYRPYPPNSEIFRILTTTAQRSVLGFKFCPVHQAVSCYSWSEKSKPINNAELKHADFPRPDSDLWRHLKRKENQTLRHDKQCRTLAGNRNGNGIMDVTNERRKL